MNRPSRTDDDLEHPEWNQNPPFLAPDLTTCEDLNGIANARELRDGGPGGGPASAFGVLNDEKNSFIDNCDKKTHNWGRNPFATGRHPPVATSETVLGGVDRACRSQPLIRPPSGWIGWILSVVAVSTIVHIAGHDVPAVFSGGHPMETTTTTNPNATVATRDSTLLLKQLAKRQDAGTGGSRCGANANATVEYNMPLHVGALVIILAVSGLSCALPMIALKFPIIRIPERFFFAVRHFGTGVLLATAFVHLLPTAFISLGDPCLSSFWTQDYPAMPGAIALLGIFFVAVIEMVFSPARHYTPRPEKGGVSDSDASERGQQLPGHRRRSTSFGGHCSQAPVLAAITRPSATTRRGSQAVIEPVSEEAVSTGGNNSAVSPNEKLKPRELLGSAVESQHLGLTEEQLHKKKILQCMLLEVGILFHSIFIGMALSVAVGGDFVVLLIAVAFHQTFEGLALGARIASIDWQKGTLQPWLMVLAYGCTTPIGQAIGLATHMLYSPQSEFGLILVGTMNAISSGLLVFAALIELLAEDFLSDDSWATLRGGKRIAACLLVLFGAICMSLVGAWA
ncbi:ZIP zinc transporter-domain-containing protein [Triangularia verruculosa]|uniref:ZIP zinc transporter-domain-containing protein n=1 Tax=Triangularia verruculosa TaxID=2587418 RepID=A0AAN6XEN7_9PEZI|nr:ZIP zinc transporter-domain-containing protein [Triangularia verruculosa]